MHVHYQETRLVKLYACMEIYTINCNDHFEEIEFDVMGWYLSEGLEDLKVIKARFKCGNIMLDGAALTIFFEILRSGD